MPDKPLCIIPARGGSKRLPRKNIIDLAGKPLLAWTIKPAFESALFDQVWVSTEDEEIRQVAEKWGARSLPRPAELAGDTITIVQLCLYILGQFEEKGQAYSSVYVLSPTNPFRTGGEIRAAWEAFQAAQADALLSVVPLEFPPQWSLVREGDWLRPWSPDTFETPRADLLPLYRPEGSYVIVRSRVLRERRSFMGARTLAYPVAASRAVDIDEPIDLSWAEFLLRQDRGRHDEG